MRRKTTAGDQADKALAGFVRLFEDALIRIVSRDANEPSLQPILIVDLREGYLEAQVLSLGTDAKLYGSPREMQIEEGEQIKAARQRTPLAAYRRKGDSRWIPCSKDRLEGLRLSPDYETTSNILAHALSLPPNERNTIFDRMLHAYLAWFSRTDADYSQVTVVIDQEEYADLIQDALTRLAPKLDGGDGSKWRTAQLLRIENNTDIHGFAFLDTWNEITHDTHKFLLITRPDKAVEYRLDATRFQLSVPEGKLKLAEYQKIIMVGSDRGRTGNSRIAAYQNEGEFRRASLRGYVCWSLRIDDAQLEKLRERHTALQKKLDTAKLLRQRLRGLQDHLRALLGELASS